MGIAFLCEKSQSNLNVSRQVKLSFIYLTISLCVQLQFQNVSEKMLIKNFLNPTQQKFSCKRNRNSPQVLIILFNVKCIDPLNYLSSNSHL